MPAPTSKKSASRRDRKVAVPVEPVEYPKLKLAIQPPFAPMEARTATSIPEGGEWLYEPKWDGFRCIAFRSGEQVVLQSKAGQPLGRYFPELLEALKHVPATKFVLDGEIVIEMDGHLDFDALLQRIHPAESRIKKLSQQTPSHIFCFDILVNADGEDLTKISLLERKQELKDFFARVVREDGAKDFLRLSPFAVEVETAEKFMTGLAEYGCDGVIAKLKDEPYHSGDRDAMLKIKRQRTADCVVGGFRFATKKENGVGSLLLGLYNSAGQLDHVGFCSSFKAEQRLELVNKLKPLMDGEGFTGKAPGGPSRWSHMNERSTEWEPLKPKLVVEVQYDHISNGRFRHGTKFLRWRPDKAAKQCTFDQLTAVAPDAMRKAG
jgi:ATP-dependent DNA ligase